MATLTRMVFLRRLLIPLVLWGGSAVLPCVAGPKLVVSEPVVDKGEVPEGEIVKHTFVLENHGDEPLLLKKLKSIGILDAEDLLTPDQHRIPPGQSVRVPVEVKPIPRPGHIPYGFALLSNDPKQPLFNLQILVTVRTVVTVTPRALYFAEARRGGIIPRHVDIAAGEKGDTPELIEITSDSRHLKPVTVPVTLPEDQTVALRVSARIGSEATFGPMRATLRARVRAETKEKTISIAVMGNVIGEFVLTPTFIYGKSLARRGAPVSHITLQAAEGAEVTLAAAVPRSDALVTRIHEIAAGKNYRVDVLLAPGARGGPLATVIDVYTDCPQLAAESVPVFLDVEPAVLVKPKYVNLRPGQRKTLTLSRPNEGPLEVRGLRCSDPTVAAKVISTSEKKDVVQVELRRAAEATPTARAWLNIETDVPGAETIRVSVTAVGTGSE